MDAGGYAACFNHEQLAMMCANSDRTIDRLGAENKQLKTENKELREFALMMLLVCKSKGIVGGVFARPDSNHNMDERVIFESRARELGIEVTS
jgi:hypothetical protein